VLLINSIYFFFLFVLSGHLIALLSRLAADQLGRELVFAGKSGKSLFGHIFLYLREFNLSRISFSD
jgi:hypothetical protein